MEQPSLESNRLILRPFSQKDAKRVRELAGVFDVSRYTEAVPYPYKDGDAEDWISTLPEEYSSGKGATFAIEHKESGSLMGGIGLGICDVHKKANLGYWLGRPYWSNGYCSEAAKRLIDYAFEERSIHRIYARHMECNPASGRVMQKIGMTLEGKLKDDIQKEGVFHTMHIYGITNSESGRQGP